MNLLGLSGQYVLNRSVDVFVQIGGESVLSWGKAIHTRPRATQNYVELTREANVCGVFLSLRVLRCFCPKIIKKTRDRLNGILDPYL